MSRLVHFDVQADDPERAIRFYESVLGWKFHKWDGPMECRLIETGPKDEPGIDGGLVPLGCRSDHYVHLHRRRQVRR